MSQVGEIEQALYHNFQTQDEDDIPVSECLKFDEGGDWEGFVLYGRLGEVDLTGYCGPQVKFGEGHGKGEL